MSQFIRATAPQMRRLLKVRQSVGPDRQEGEVRALRYPVTLFVCPNGVNWEGVGLSGPA